jgi:hypothetical protein
VGNAAIALIRLPALAPRRSPLYKGPILFNPGEYFGKSSDYFLNDCQGGPGGSGVSFVLNTGELFQTSLGTEYDIVGFDPRGAYAL